MNGNNIEKMVGDMFAAGYNCSQIVASYFAENYGMDTRQIKKMACGFGAGMRHGDMCGAVSGGIMVIGMKYGSNTPFAAEARNLCYEKTIEFERKYAQKEGSVICRELLGCDISTDIGHEYAVSRGLCPMRCPKLISSSIMLLKELGYDNADI